MNPKTVRTLMWISIILLVAGSAIGSPAGAMIVMILAAACALAPVVAGARGQRIVGAVVLLASIGLAVSHYSMAKGHMETYRETSTKPNPAIPPVPAQRP